jgi:hypothetical protein
MSARTFRIREGRHHVQITARDVELYSDKPDLSVQDLVDASFQAQKAGDHRRAYVLARAAVRRYERSLECARETA